MITREILIGWAEAFPAGTWFQGDEDGDIHALVGEWPYTYFRCPEVSS